MAVMRNSIIFGGVDSADFGIYISGEGVFNAPKRAVEYIQVPGRNGAFALDQGYYENIEVTYPGFNYESDMDDFCDQLAGFRNAICSQKGYQRLSDTFHPNEYRMAVYSEGLEIEPMKYNTASNFKLKFNCKPQRYLTSGETELTVTSGQTINNPTLFDSSPLLAVKGYGTIEFNGYTIEIENAGFGTINIADAVVSQEGYMSVEITVPDDVFNTGDDISFASIVFTQHIGNAQFFGVWYNTPTPTITDSNASARTSMIDGPDSRGMAPWMEFITYVNPLTLHAGTAETWQDVATVSNITACNISGTTLATCAVKYTFTVQYVPNSRNGGKITISIAHEATAGAQYIQFMGSNSYSGNPNITVRRAVGESTVSFLGDPTYIDCDLGEAYRTDTGEVISLNGYIDLGSDLPTLGAGNNTVTFSNTVTQLKLTPRFWIL